mmetsp:Transcript_33520/g.79535  ORF Transcript_33520/g.79535 Transcript_33520/m.79535 type:complete len:212 (-) Transcript_33520:344-979(-)
MLEKIGVGRRAAWVRADFAVTPEFYEAVHRSTWAGLPSAPPCPPPPSAWRLLEPMGSLQGVYTLSELFKRRGRRRALRVLLGLVAGGRGGREGRTECAARAMGPSAGCAGRAAVSAASSPRRVLQPGRPPPDQHPGAPRHRQQAGQRHMGPAAVLPLPGARGVGPLVRPRVPRRCHAQAHALRRDPLAGCEGLEERPRRRAPEDFFREGGV